ncbi:carbon storage regulator (plasmid) [Xanthomonas campestris pv. campestris]|uniref:carbon storage regulator n=1 Tax=Xanthomonas campestris TaxID=339 RepID=UPI002367A0C9|nr:carbon storage regulator [Xanthomonas campestris]MEB1409555.1 carbon storage regulator [Xanthomonas campestris pv. campestris]MEB1509466.1 carbon storage regulator [Xanthomonas campestris pv. campestris]MEB1872764.1 carbon storage regulator [Xanthomonas campestris pv. campestris]MEB1909859.1 carbon storage regulator [Xanthomonas campestris pv. campestris]WDJ45359.1 carbon storage regulator [Xanthomonas campestris pv. campestris]
MAANNAAYKRLSMLILTRKERESIVIADTISVTVMKIRRGRATLTIAGLGAHEPGTYDLRVGAHLMVREHVTITVHGISDGQVKLDIVAPRAVPVHREEVAARIRAEMQVQACSHRAQVGLPLAAAPV